MNDFCGRQSVLLGGVGDVLLSTDPPNYKGASNGGAGGGGYNGYEQLLLNGNYFSDCLSGSATVSNLDQLQQQQQHIINRTTGSSSRQHLLIASSKDVSTSSYENNNVDDLSNTADI